MDNIDNSTRGDHNWKKKMLKVLGFLDHLPFDENMSN